MSKSSDVIGWTFKSKFERIFAGNIVQKSPVQAIGEYKVIITSFQIYLNEPLVKNLVQ